MRWWGGNGRKSDCDCFRGARPDFRDQLIAAQLKELHPHKEREFWIYFRDQLIAAQLKAKWETSSSPRRMHFRDQLIAAQLKDEARTPRARDGGPYFRDQLIAAQLKARRSPRPGRPPALISAIS